MPEVTMVIPEDPAGKHFFALEVDGVEVAHFLECSGIKTSCEPFEIEEGGLNDRVHRFAGPAKWDNVVFRVATQKSKALAAWRERCRRGDQERSSGAVILYGIDGDPVERFDIVEVWPVRWEGPQLDSTGSALAVEELEISHQGIAVS